MHLISWFQGVACGDENTTFDRRTMVVAEVTCADCVIKAIALSRVSISDLEDYLKQLILQRKVLIGA